MSPRVEAVPEEDKGEGSCMWAGALVSPPVLALKVGSCPLGFEPALGWTGVVDGATGEMTHVGVLQPLLASPFLSTMRGDGDNLFFFKQKSRLSGGSLMLAGEGL